MSLRILHVRNIQSAYQVRVRFEFGKRRVRILFGTWQNASSGSVRSCWISGENLKKESGGGWDLGSNEVAASTQRMGSAERLSKRVRAEPGHQMSFSAFYH